MSDYFIRYSTKEGTQEQIFKGEQAWKKAEETAEKIANEKRFCVYVGAVGCHPMDEHFYQYDKYWKRAVKFTCND